MRTPLSWLGLGTLALAGLPVPATAQPVGSEFQINTYTTHHQERPSVSADANGNFVVVWHSRDQDGSGAGVFGQRYDGAGAPLGGEFRVNAFTGGSQHSPAVAAAPGGDFIVVWTSVGRDGSGEGIFGQRYDSAGLPAGDPFRVNSYTPDDQEDPAVASDASGNFVVVWTSWTQDGSSMGIFGQRFDSSGGVLGGEFRVNSYTTSLQLFSSVASDPSGNFVVVWSSYTQDGDSLGIFGQRFDSSGGVLGGEFQVNSSTYGPQDWPAVASDTAGNFVVVWASPDDDALGTFAQRYAADGLPLGGEFQVNSYMTNHQYFSSVAFDASGNFVVVWTGSGGQDGQFSGIFAQRYDSGGVAQGAEFQVNSYTTNLQRRPSVVATGANQFAVAWQSQYQDGSGWGVFGQRFDFGGASTIHVGDLDRRAKNVGASWRAQVTTLVHDDGHSPFSGVLVTLDVSGVGTRTCTTTAAGQCEVSVLISDSVASLTFSVTNLLKTGFTYTPAGNHDPDPDSDGTVIVVNQP